MVTAAVLQGGDPATGPGHVPTPHSGFKVSDQNGSRKCWDTRFAENIASVTFAGCLMMQSKSRQQTAFPQNSKSTQTKTKPSSPPAASGFDHRSGAFSEE